MNASDLIEHLKTNGIELSTSDGERLVVTPSDRLTDADRYLIRTLKRKLLDQLGPKPLPPKILAALNDWLDAIGETDPECRAEYIEACAADPERLPAMRSRPPPISAGGSRVRRHRSSSPGPDHA
ncbi:MAG: hypothetical protein MZV65_27305 [Chromatiales bacterium]|nr:hypothetical protein [Chromatiales bacterium]